MIQIQLKIVAPNNKIIVALFKTVALKATALLKIKGIQMSL